MKKTSVLLAFAIAAALAAFTSCQTPSAPPAEDRFAKADTNHDGKLTRNESGDYFVTTMFTGRDLNHDGALTWEEWNVPGAGGNKARFEAADTNNDGGLSLDEALGYGRKRGVFEKDFDAADTNNDGYVTREEAQIYYGSTEGPWR